MSLPGIRKMFYVFLCPTITKLQYVIEIQKYDIPRITKYSHLPTLTLPVVMEWKIRV